MTVEKKGQAVTPFRPCLFFSYPFVRRYAFVERLFRMYFSGYQSVIYLIQLFNVFVVACKSAGIRSVRQITQTTLVILMK